MVITALTKAIAVPREVGELARRILRQHDLVNRDLQIKALHRALLIPVKDARTALRVLEEHGLPALGIVVAALPRRREPTRRSLREILRELAPQCVDKVPRSYYIVGDIALIDLDPSAVAECGEPVARALMELHPRIRAVYAKGSTVGVERVRELIHLGGEARTRTVHREHGISILIDIARAYFNPALGEEHHRLAQRVKHNEVVLDAFTGVGPFALHIARRASAYVLALDINLEALELLAQSTKMNTLRGFIDPVNTDTQYLLNAFRDEVFDHVILNLPHRATQFVEQALRVTKRGGQVHVYTIAESPEKATEKVLSALPTHSVVVDEVRKVLDYAPRKYIYRVTLIKA